MSAVGGGACMAIAAARIDIIRWWCQADESGDASFSGSALDEAAGDILRRASLVVHVRRGGRGLCYWGGRWAGNVAGSDGATKHERRRSPCVVASGQP